MYKVLVVEDSAEYAGMIQKTLGAKYTTHMAASLAAARDFAGHYVYDVILLDIILPDGNGFDFCTELRAIPDNKNTPIIILSGKGEVQDKVMGWSLGADDYIVKPFAPLEFQARVQNRIDKNRQQEKSSKTLRWGSVSLDLSFHQAKIEEEGSERDLDLTLIEFNILSSLVKNPDRVLTRTQIIESAWGQNVNVGERTVDKHMSTLRKKFQSQKVAIRTVSGIGYRLVRK